MRYWRLQNDLFRKTCVTESGLTWCHISDRPSPPQSSRRTPLWDIFDERESTDSFDNEDEEMVTFELSEMLLMLLAAGTDDEVTDSEDEWDLFHEELDDFYEIYL